MNRLLTGTSTLALSSAIVLPANASEWDVRVGGFAESYLGYATSDVDNALLPFDFDGVDAKFDGEIHFLPAITLDNGLRIGADVQLETGEDAQTDLIDEAYMIIEGSFGRVEIGDENSAGFKMHYGAPDVSFLGINSGSTTIFVPYSGSIAGVAVGDDVFRGTLGSTFLENERNNDAGRITYFTPRFEGFQFGLSYARDA